MRLDGDQVAAVDHHLVDRSPQTGREGLELNLEEMQLVVFVQEIGESFLLQADPAKHPLVRAVCGEADERRLRADIRLEHLLGSALDEELEATWGRLELH